MGHYPVITCPVIASKAKQSQTVGCLIEIAAVARLPRNDSSVYILLFLLLSLLLPRISNAQVNVTHHLENNRGAKFEARIVVTGATVEKLTPPKFEQSQIFEVQETGRDKVRAPLGEEQTIQLIYSYLMVPQAGTVPGSYPLPSAFIELDGKSHPLKFGMVAVLFDDDRPLDAEKKFFLKQELSNLTPYVGQQVNYRLIGRIPARTTALQLSTFEATDFLTEEVIPTKKDDGLDYMMLERVEALFPQVPGQIRVSARTITMKVPLTISKTIPGDRPLGNKQTFGMQDLLDPIAVLSLYENEKRLSAGAVVLQVKSLPTAPAGVGGYIPVGNFTLHVDFNPKQAKVNDSVKLLVVVQGDGNLRPFQFPQPQSAHSRFYSEEPSLEVSVFDGRLIHKKKFSIVMIPNVAGSLTIPQLRLVTFDPQANRYVEQQSQVVTLEVEGSEGAGKTPILSAGGVVTVLGDDLRPQHASPTARVRRNFSPGVVLAGFLFIPISLVFFKYQRRFVKDDGKLRQAEALLQAIKALDEWQTVKGHKTYDQLISIFRNYLEQKFATSFMKTKTPKELLQFLERQLADQQVIGEVRVYLAEMTRLQFAGDGALQEDNLMDNRLRVLLKKIDSSLGG